jgi:hypothetical protein
MKEQRNRFFMIFVRPYYIDDVTKQPVAYKGSLLETISSKTLASFNMDTPVEATGTIVAGYTYTSGNSNLNAGSPLKLAIGGATVATAPYGTTLTVSKVYDSVVGFYYEVTYNSNTYWVEKKYAHTWNVTVTGTASGKQLNSPDNINEEQHLSSDGWLLHDTLSSFGKVQDRIKELLTVYTKKDIMVCSYIPIDFKLITGV